MNQNTKTCKTCGAEIAKGLRVCPNCGSKQLWGRGRLVTCKDCGNLISANADVCPHCGRKQHFAAYAALAVILVMTFTICAIGIFSSTPDSRTGDPNTNGNAAEESQPSALSVSAFDLHSAYSANKVSADETYKDKLLAVSGTIVDIGQDVVTKAPCISLDTSGGGICLYPVLCFFPKDSDLAKQIGALSDGDPVTIYGNCDGTPLVNVQLTDCHF